MTRAGYGNGTPPAFAGRATRKTGTVPRQVLRWRFVGLSLVFRRACEPVATTAGATGAAAVSTIHETTPSAVLTATSTAIRGIAVRTTRRATRTAERSAILTAAAQATHRTPTRTVEHTTRDATRKTTATATCRAIRETAGRAKRRIASRAIWNAAYRTTRGMAGGTFENTTQPTWNQSVSSIYAFTVLYPITKPESLASRGLDLS